jgi:RimJ/RimL family protein N-acetyltransferase
VAIYAGSSLADGDLLLAGVRLSEVLSAPKSSDYATEIDSWVQLATTREDILYFAIRHRGELIGQVFLHDWERTAHSALVGCHVFLTGHRGLGFGTRALGLLLGYVATNTDIERLFAITTEENIASRAIGRRNGFLEIGRPREDPVHGLVMEWRVEETLRWRLSSREEGNELREANRGAGRSTAEPQPKTDDS